MGVKTAKTFDSLREHRGPRRQELLSKASMQMGGGQGKASLER